MREYSRDELLALTPARYLAQGFLDARGRARPEFRSDYATAAATQFLAAELSAQELAFTLEAVRQLLPLHNAAPRQRMMDTAEEALETVARMIRQPNNPVLEKWIRECAASITDQASLEAFLDHFVAVVRQYTIFAASLPSDSSSPAPG